VLRRLLLPPLLAPLLALLVVALLNPRPRVSLRLLTWSAGPLPLGAWIALAGVGGAALSAGATSLALGEGTLPLRRQGRQRSEADSAEPWEEAAGEEFAPFARRRGRESTPPDWAARGVGGSREPGEPAPTISVPFRVLRRGPASPPATATATAGWGRPAEREPGRPPGRPPEREPEPVPAAEEWGAAANDDW
jgi:hypothetical protein